MNLILLEGEELRNGADIVLTGRRAAHIVEVLRARPGDALRVGVLGGKVGRATVVAVAGGSVTLSAPALDTTPPAPWFDLALAIPRPKVLHRLWAPLAALGVRRIELLNAAKVERFYFDTHWLEESSYAPLLAEGLEQAGTTQMPTVTVRRAFRPFVEDVVPTLYAGAPKFVAHPRVGASAPLPSFSQSPAPGTPLPLVAIGPEGGWTDFEIGLLEKAGFQPFTLGARVLRTDTACAAICGALCGARISGPAQEAR